MSPCSHEVSALRVAERQQQQQDFLQTDKENQRKSGEAPAQTSDGHNGHQLETSAFYSACVPLDDMV
jgi:hypothetical protein